MKDYYIAAFLIGEDIHHCIWYADNIDGFITEGEYVVSFPSLDEAEQYCRELKIRLESDISYYNINGIKDWLWHKEQPVECELFFDFWNVISDMANSLKAVFIGDNRELTEIYNKLFWGLNLPALNKTESKYIPKWSKEEVKIIRKVIIKGLGILECGLGISILQHISI